MYMNKEGLILKGDTSAAKAFVRFLPLLIFFGAAGVLFLGLGMFAISTIGSNRNHDAAVLGSMMLPVLGLIFIFAAIAFPLAGISEAKKRFINVYENYVSGTYTERYQGYVPYTLTYDKIECVSANKKRVYLQISGRTICSTAFNAQEIAAAIQSRLNRRY